jgi:hypothetical protein
MESFVYDFVDQCIRFHVTEILFGLAALLILIDYYFPTDVPAHFGYVCLSLAVFFVAYLNAFPLLVCLLSGIGFWVLLAYLHQTLFRHVLTNAPGTERHKRSGSE